MAQSEVKLPPVNLLNFNRLRFWMADITMCMDMSCSEKLSCYRYSAVANPYRQAYFVKSPRNTEGTCEYYWKMEEHDESRNRHRDNYGSQEDSRSRNQGH